MVELDVFTLDLKWRVCMTWKDDDWCEDWSYKFPSHEADHVVFRHVRKDSLFLFGETTHIGETAWAFSTSSLDILSTHVPVKVFTAL